MAELVQLENNSPALASAKTRIWAVSNDPPALAKETQDRFPNLTIVADADNKLLNALGVLGPHTSPEGKLVAAPTSVIVDRTGIVRKIYRSGNYFQRNTAADLLKLINEALTP